MTGSEILDYVETRLGRTIDSDLILEAINECLDEIGDMGYIYATSDVTVTDTTEWYSLPDDFTHIKDVVYQDNEDETFDDWDYRNGTINFNEEGDYKIIARQMPEHLTAIGDSFTDIHRLYHNGIKYYAMAWVLENDDPDDPNAQRMYNRFTNKITRAKNTLLNNARTTTWEVKRI